jgi:HSP20 family molecular chaperone IbpA
MAGGSKADHETGPFDELMRIQDRVDCMVRGLVAVTEMNMDMLGMDIGQQDSDIIVTVDLPRLDFRQHDGDILVTADMPGADENDIDVNILDERVLEISSRKNSENAGEEEAGFSQRERRYMFYCRSIMLLAPVTRTKATYDNGVLTLTLSAKRKVEGKMGATTDTTDTMSQSRSA